MSKDFLKDFILVGGTALALQIGHRISVDLDLFSNIPFSATDLADFLREKYQFELDFISENTLKGEIGGVQVDCIAHRYPWLEKKEVVENLRLASLKDIAAMKLNAISGDGTRLKDFIDLAFLSTKLSLNNMLNGYKDKYNSNPIMPLKAIVYYSDINFNEPIKITGNKPFKWDVIEKRLDLMQKSPDKTFERLW